ncbi:transposase [filamentous cyanobacterium LEGE 11480]|uniref:Transposase n=1 Tax=Romeriopsis navalis LEGE 11480 TaxID=2777977 RepID=A0A928VNB5_9CYAN|nr:transposase [Romeriopsis navalis]MBE9029019.1 transposase [Romeriopsis navalis LEGE 11480]
MRKSRTLRWKWCYHITIRCNSRAFRLLRRVCREVLLYALSKCREKFGFKLYGLCIMSNHVHYLLEPREPEDLPRLMHWLNWYTAMCFNRMLNRTGHFWEKRYHSTGFPNSDYRRALNTLRYIHGNPKVAAMQQGFFYDFSNYGIYDRLTEDGLTQWHPAFLALAASLELCAAAYRKFCRRYQPKPKPPKRHRWGSKLLGKIRARGKPKKVSPGQKSLWDDWDLPAAEILAVAEKFVQANQYPPKPPDPYSD